MTEENIYKIDINVSNFTKVELKSCIVAAKQQLETDLFKVERTAKEDYLSGPRPQKLGVVTGALRSGIKTSVSSTSDSITGKVGFGKHVWYGKLHEEGLGGMRKRAFLVPSIEDHIDMIEANILQAIKATLEDIR